MEEFDRAVAERAFALWWSAHGLKYGLPLSIDADISTGRTVVCNVSRTIVSAARARYAQVAAVLVTGPPPEVLAARVAERGCVSDGDVAMRITRSAPSLDNLRPDFVIATSGRVEAAASRFISIIQYAGAAVTL